MSVSNVSPQQAFRSWKGYFPETGIGSLNVDFSALDDVEQKAQYDSSVSGAVNAIFGATLYKQYNDENNFVAALPVIDRSAERNLQNPTAKAFRAAHSPVPLQTHTEGGTIPDGETFSVEEVEFDVKRSETVLEVSDVQQILRTIEDAVGLEEFLEIQEDQLDLALDRDALAAPALESDSAYADVDEPTPLDRAIASSDEEANANDASGVAYTDGALDYGSIDRSADTWADSYVDHNSGTLRQLTKSLMDDFVDAYINHGSAREEDVVLLTGRNSARVLSEIQKGTDNPVRVAFDDEGREQVNDAETPPGVTGTTRIRTYDGIPIVANQNAPADSLERIYAIDTSTINGVPKIGIEQYAEPYTETAGRGQQQGYIAQGEYREKALFLLNHELVVRDFGAMGKLMDVEE